ncbi:MAG: preprotein translocase subunit YajC [Clostridiaceae bacterium]|nr:preprotein translocase subunit YajC [Clostridiaceae bacterium]
MYENLGGLIIPIGFLAIFYFLIIRPQQKREKKTKEMRNNLKVGDEVVTIGGIHGSIMKIKDDMITIEVGADKVKLSIAKWAIGNVVNESK